jgi:integrase
MLAKLMHLHKRLLKGALSKPLSFWALADAQPALAVAIPLYAPLRATNLAGLTFGKSIFLPKRESEETQIYIAPEEAKTNEPYLTVLPPKLTALIKTYVARILVPYTGRGAHFLFDNGAGRQKRVGTISWLIQRTLKRHLGLRMGEHQFRHVNAKLLRDAGADYETIRQLLGHKDGKPRSGSTPASMRRSLRASTPPFFSRNSWRHRKRALPGTEGGAAGKAWRSLGDCGGVVNSAS